MTIPRFSLREMILITAIVALGLTVQKLPEPVRPGGFPASGRQITIEGPLLVNYREQTSPNSTSGSNQVPMRAVHFVDGAVVFEYTNGRFQRIESSRLVILSWQAE